MNIVQKMLKKQFTEATGLQDPLRELGLNFQVYRSIPFVQVFQDSRMHQDAISAYGCNQGEIYLMDSLFNSRILEHTKEQVCSILNWAAGKIKINLLPVQQQSSGVDCRIYALAFCFYILSKEQINKCFFQSRKIKVALVTLFNCRQNDSFHDVTASNQNMCRYNRDN